MRVRFLALLGLAILLLSASPAYGQVVANKTDRSMIKSCGHPPPEVAGMTIWHADNVGTNRLIPGMPGSTNLQVFKFFAADDPTDILSDDERARLRLARAGIEESVAYLLFNEAGTDIDQARVKPPTDFYDELIAAATPDNLRADVLPCWTVLHAGLTYGTRLTGSLPSVRVKVYALPGPVAIGWYQEGVYTDDGQPGVKVSITRPVTPKEGPFQDVPVEVLVFDICGNVSGRVSLGDIEDVRADKPLDEKPPPERRLANITPKTPPPVPPRLPEGESELASDHEHWIPCWRPKWQIPICAAPLLLLLRGEQGTSPLVKSGGPGTRPAIAINIRW